MEKKMPTSATNEFGKHPCKEELNGVVGKSTRKDMILVVLWKHLKTEVKFCHRKQ